MPHTHTSRHLPPSSPLFASTGKDVACSDMGDGVLRALIARAAAFEEQIR